MADSGEAPRPVQVASGIWRFPLPMDAPPQHINSWLLEDGDGWLAVDCGTRSDKTRESWRGFMASDLYRRGITRIFLTHAHPDHAGSAPWLARETGAPVMMAAREHQALENFATPDERRDEEIRGRLEQMGASAEQVKMAQLFYQHFAQGCPQIHSQIDYVEPGDELTINGRRWQLHGGYGHTPCNLLMHQPDAGFLITGDQILPDIVTHVGVWWRQSENPLGFYLESLTRLRELEVSLAFPAHGDPFTGYQARCDQLAETHAQRLERIEKSLRLGPQSLQGLLHRFGGSAVAGPAFPLVAGQIWARLARLVSQERVLQQHDDEGGVQFRLPA